MLNELVPTTLQEKIDQLLDLIDSESSVSGQITPLFLGFNNRHFQHHIGQFLTQRYSPQLTSISLQNSGFDPEKLNQLEDKAIKLIELEAGFTPEHLAGLLSQIEKLRANSQDSSTGKNFLWLLTARATTEQLSPLIPTNPDQLRVIDFNLVLADINALINQASDRYWSRGANVKTQKDLANLDSAFQTIEEFLETHALALENEAQIQFQILKGLYQEFTGQFEAALEWYQQAIASSQQAQTPSQTQWILIQTTHCCFLRAYWEKELSHPAWQKTRDYLTQSLQLLAADNWHSLRGDSLTLLGRVLRGLEDWEQLKQLVENFIDSYVNSDNPEDIAQLPENTPSGNLNPLLPNLTEAYGFLGECFIEQWQFQAAHQAVQKALESYRRSPETLADFHSWLHYLLGRSLMGLKEEEEAITLLESAKNNTTFETDPQLYLAILIELRYCYYKRQDALKVLEIDQLYQSLEYRMGKRNFIGVNALSNLNVFKLTHPLISVDFSTAKSSIFPIELTHSQRTKDIEKIQSLIVEQQKPLLFLYGESGTGKTSLIQAGLIPSLQHNASSYVTVLLNTLESWQTRFKNQLLAICHPIGEQDKNLQQDLNDQQIILRLLNVLAKQSRRVVVCIDPINYPTNTQLLKQLEQDLGQFLKACIAAKKFQIIFCLSPDSLSPILDYVTTHFYDIPYSLDFYSLKSLSEEQTWQVIQGLFHKISYPFPPNLTAALIQDLSDPDQQINCRELQIMGTILEDQQIKTLEDYEDQGKAQLINYYIKSIIKICSPLHQKVATICLYLLSQVEKNCCLKSLGELKAELGQYGISINIKQLDGVLTLLVKSGLLTTVSNHPETYYRSLTLPLAHSIRQAASVAQHHLPQKNGLSSKVTTPPESENTPKETLVEALVIEQNRRELQLQLEDAKSQYQNVLTGIRLERQSLITLKQFETQQLEGLMLALKAGQELQELVTEDTPLIDYPSISPLLTLQNILSQIYERNRLHQPASVTDLQVSPNRQWIITASSDGTARIWEVTGQQRAFLKGHEGAITSVRWSPNGAYVLTASADGTARLWSITGELLAVFQGHQDWVRSAQFSPDNHWVVTASRDGTAKLWDLTGAERAVLVGHQSWVRSAEFSPNSQYIVTASKDGTAKLWNLRGQELTTLRGHQSWVRNARFNPNGQLIVTASADGTARLWDLSGRQIAILNGHHNWVRNAEFSPTGDCVLTASADGTARLWDLSGKALAILQGHYQGLYDAHFSPNGQLIVTTSSDKTARLWNRKGKALVILRGHQQDVYQAEFSGDRHLLVTVSADRTARIWDLSDKGNVTLRGHSHWVRNAHFSTSGDRIITTSRDKTARIWDNTGKALFVLEGHQDWVRNAAFSPNGQFVVTASADKTAQLWSTSGMKLTTFQGHHDVVLEAQFSPDGQYILTASKDKTARVWNASGRSLAVLRKHQDAVYSAAFSPDGQFIVTASGDCTACVWDIIGREMATCIGHEQPIYSAVLNSDNEFLVTASADKTARVWDITGKPVAILVGHHSVVYQARFSPDENLIVTASADKTACIWSRTGQKLAVLYGHQGLISTAEWSPDGQMIVTASEDGTARLWDRMGRELATLQGHQSWVRTAEFSPDGHWVVTASTDGTARLWHIDTLTELMNKGNDWLQDYVKNNLLIKESENTTFQADGSPTILSNSPH
ncbi:MAG: ATP-binding protein [Snowella sp.]|nr:ATP-binding protein [Snowella sp.]